MNKKLLREFKKSGISNYELAKLTGIAASTIGRWVRGETDLGISKFEEIAKAIGVKVDI